MKKTSPPADVRAREYELTYLLPTFYTDGEARKLQSSIEEMIGKFQGSDIKVEPWGKQRLAYSLRRGGKKHTEAVYTHLKFTLPSIQAPLLDAQVKLKPEILRYLLVVSEPTPPSTELVAPTTATE